MGAVVGAIASGRIPAGGVAGDPWSSWVNPTSILGGVMAVVMVAYLASVYLTWDAHRLADDEMTEYFRRRAIVAAVAAGVVAFAGIFVLHHDDPFLYQGLTSRGLPAIIVSALCGLGSLVLLMRHAARWARVLAAGAVATIVLGWGMAQWDYVLPQSLTVAQAAAPSGTITAVLIATAIAVIVLGPSFALLYTLDQRSLLPGEGVHDQASTS